MNAQKYTVKWETVIAPGATYYSGTKEVYAFPDEDLEWRLRRKVAGQTFKPSQIKIVSYEETHA